MKTIIKNASLISAFFVSLSCATHAAVVSGLIVDEMNPLDNIYSIDLDRDGSEDYRMLAGQIFSSQNKAKVAGYAFRPISASSGAVAQVFAGGQPIDTSHLASDYEWINLSLADRYGLQLSLFLEPKSMGDRGTGEWFVGLKIEEGEQSNYGWLKVYTERVGGLAWALETSYETDPNQTLITPIPEPTMLLSVKLVTALSCLRRRRLEMS